MGISFLYISEIAAWYPIYFYVTLCPFGYTQRDNEKHFISLPTDRQRDKIFMISQFAPTFCTK